MMNSRMSRRSFLTSTAKVSALAAFGSVIAACAPASPGAPADSGGDAAPSTEPIVLEFTQWGEGVVPGEQPPNYEPFLEENPHITIEHYSYPDYDQKLYLMLYKSTKNHKTYTQEKNNIKNISNSFLIFN